MDNHPCHMSHNESVMINNSMQLLNSNKIEDPVELLRHLCLARGFSGFLNLGRCFRDKYGNGENDINFNQFTKAMQNTGFDLSVGQIEEIFHRFEENSGINIGKLLANVRPLMSSSRKSIVHAAFQKMDKECAGYISIKCLEQFYNVTSNPRFESGYQSREIILKKFIDHFEENHHAHCNITKEDFDNYYAALSASVDDDTYFDLVIRQVYKLDNHHPSHISHNESVMINKSLQLLDSDKIVDIIELLRHLCLARGFSGFLSFGRCFRQMDENGKHVLNLTQFVKAMHNTGFDLSHGQTEELFKRFDVDGSGGINIGNLLASIRPHMPSSRKRIIDAAFKKMDKKGAGVISMDCLKHFYNVSSNPRYESGVQSHETILKNFIDHFEEHHRVNGDITKEDFENYYAALSASVEDDTYFDLVIRQVYKL